MNVIDITTRPVEDTTPIGDDGVHHIGGPPASGCDHRQCDGRNGRPKPGSHDKWTPQSGVACKCGRLWCLDCIEAIRENQMRNECVWCGK